MLGGAVSYPEVVENPKRFLIAHPDPAVRESLAEKIQKLSPKAHCFFAIDGTDAGFKLSNAAHHVAFLASDLPKRNAIQLTEWIMAEKQLEQLAIVILSPIPDREHFVEAVVAGRVQFFGDFNDEVLLEKCLTRGLNFYFQGDKDDFHLRILATGEVLMREGERGDRCYLVTKGQMRAVRHLDGKDVVLGYVEPGEFVGEMAYINGEPRSADVLAERGTELIEIPFERLDHVLFQKPVWAKALMRTLSKRLKVANEFRSGDQ